MRDIKARTSFTAKHAASVDGRDGKNTHCVTRPRKSVHGAFPVVLRSLVFILHNEHYRSPQRQPKLRATMYLDQVLLVSRCS